MSICVCTNFISEKNPQTQRRKFNIMSFGLCVLPFYPSLDISILVYVLYMLYKATPCIFSFFFFGCRLDRAFLGYMYTNREIHTNSQVLVYILIQHSTGSNLLIKNLLCLIFSFISGV